MEYKDAMKTFVLIAVGLGVLLIVLAYLGVVRYYMIKNSKSTETYSREYLKLPKKANGKTIITFSTFPGRFKEIKPMINSILGQTSAVDSIITVLPVDKAEIPDFLKGIVAVVPSGKDYGEGNAIIPVLLTEKECNTTIVALKDNFIYGKDCIETFLKESEKCKDTILTDKNNSIYVFQPTCFQTNVINREKSSFDKDWFLNKAKHAKIINYRNNYKY